MSSNSSYGMKPKLFSISVQLNNQNEYIENLCYRRQRAIAKCMPTQTCDQLDLEELKNCSGMPNPRIYYADSRTAFTNTHSYKLLNNGWYFNSAQFLPTRRYASAGLCDSDVSVCLSVCLSVCHTPVLCLAERKQDREMYTI